MAALEKEFRVPVIEAYGMTEAAHQIAGNPLPPGIRKPGSVGLPSCAAVAILDAGGKPLETGKTGEVAIRGENVTAGYETESGAGGEAFADGWLRTGDLGRLDGDGYLYLTGRLKEIINRGGYKISPAEIDETLMSHPRVVQASAFAIPHPTLGEDVAVAVVADGAESLSERELREYALSRLTELKAPSRVLFVGEIPKGPTGKLQRSELAGRLGHLLKADYIDPRDEVESDLREIWRWLLEVEPVGVRDNFFDLGGTSLLAVRLFSHIQDHFGKSLPLSTLVHAPTIEELAGAIRGNGWAARWKYLVPIRTAGDRPPFFCVHPHDGDAFRFREMAVMLKPDQPFYGLRARAPEGKEPSNPDIMDMAREYVEEIRRFQPSGPYFLGGECTGGAIALEMARRLLQEGEQVAFAAMILSFAPGGDLNRPGMNFLTMVYYRIRTEIDFLLTMRSLLEPAGRRRFLRDMIRANAIQVGYLFKRLYYKLFSAYGEAYIREEDDQALRMREAVNAFHPDVYPERLTLLRMEKIDMKLFPSEDWGWGKIAQGGVDVHVIPGYSRPYKLGYVYRKTGEKLSECLAKAQGDGV
jgi:thioesterase domain-containing protein/acyl carrier protein